MIKTTALKLATVLAVAVALAQVGSAQSVNRRLNWQNHRITHGVQHHQLNKYQARTLRSGDHKVRAEEKFDRLHDHGNLTNRQKATLQRQLNKNSRRIWNAKRHV